MTSQSYAEWCDEHGCSHAHCPDDCENPQPFVADDGALVCGRCAVIRRVRSEMEPCLPHNCPEG